MRRKSAMISKNLFAVLSLAALIAMPASFRADKAHNWNRPIRKPRRPKHGRKGKSSSRQDGSSAKAKVKAHVQANKATAKAHSKAVKARVKSDKAAVKKSIARHKAAIKGKEQ